MKLIKEETGEEVQVGDSFRDDDGQLYIVSGLQFPHKPSSTGRIQAEYPDGSVVSYFPSVFGMKWIEREDQGWVHPEVQLNRVLDVLWNIYEEDFSGYDLADVIKKVRDTRIVDLPLESVRFMKDWLEENKHLLEE